MTNKNFYIYENHTNSAGWWTITPAEKLDDTTSHSVMQMSPDGLYSVRAGNNSNFSKSGVRPVLSLKSCVQWSSGNGTSSSPYEVTVTSACSNKEN